MKKRYFVINAFFVLIPIFAIPFLDEIYVSTFLGMMPVYFFFYGIYLLINRISLFRRRIEFNDKLLIIPLLLLGVYVVAFGLVTKEYRDINGKVSANVSRGMICSEIEDCKEVLQGFYIKTWLTKNYRVFIKDGCSRIYSPNYALEKFNYQSCEDKKNLSDL